MLEYDKIAEYFFGIEIIYGGKYDISTYVTKEPDVRFEDCEFGMYCNRCKRYYVTTMEKLLTKGESCCHNSLSRKRVSGTNELRLLLKEKYGKQYSLSNVWFGYVINLTCTICGFSRNVHSGRLNVSETRCPLCESGLIYSQDTNMFLYRLFYRFPELKDKGDFSKFVFVNRKVNGTVTCDEGHTFEISPLSMYSGQWCRACGYIRSGQSQWGTYEEFVVKAYDIHGDLYNYRLSNFKNGSTKIEIICNRCGEHFWQKPSGHLLGRGCNTCNRAAGNLERCAIPGHPGLVSYERYKDRLKLTEVIDKTDLGELLVSCKFCKKMHVPDIDQVFRRIYCLNRVGKGESNFYCSEDCKSRCDVYGKSPNHIPLDSKLHRSRAKARSCQQGSKRELLRLQLDECDHNYCEKCGKESESLDLHHTIPVARDADASINPAGHMLLCRECHNTFRKCK